MLKHKTNILPLIHIIVGTGSSIRFWEDPWMEGSRLIDRLDWSSMMQVGSPKAVVADFIFNGRWQLPTPQMPKFNGYGEKSENWLFRERVPQTK